MASVPDIMTTDRDRDLESLRLDREIMTDPATGLACFAPPSNHELVQRIQACEQAIDRLERMLDDIDEVTRRRIFDLMGFTVHQPKEKA